MRSVTASRFLAVISAVAAGFLVVLVLLPHDPYVRFREAATESVNYLRLRWIYERIHFDTTPIDVAFIGTSHTQSAIDSRIVEESLRQRGLDLHVVNLAVPHLGRDLHYLLMRELLESRTVREVVVEVQDFEPRAPHPAFQRVAGTEDLLSSPLVVNTGYFENLVRLPRRQLDLFALMLAGGWAATFDRAAYQGPHWDDTEKLHGFERTRDETHPETYLQDKADLLWLEFKAKEALAARLQSPDGCSLLKRYNRLYLQKLLDLAHERRVHVTFLYLPFFHGPAAPHEVRYYKSFGPIVTPQAALADATSWLNVDHLNVYGARRASRWIGETLVMQAPALPPPGDVPCY